MAAAWCAAAKPRGTSAQRPDRRREWREDLPLAIAMRLEEVLEGCDDKAAAGLFTCGLLN